MTWAEPSTGFFSISNNGLFGGTDAFRGFEYWKDVNQVDNVEIYHGLTYTLDPVRRNTVVRGQGMNDFSEELKKDFLDEAFDLLDKLEKSLLALEKDSSDDKAINEVFRIAHTIKGGAGTVGFNEILSLTHILEDVLDLVRKKILKLNTGNISLFLECRDELEKMLNAREQGRAHVSDRMENLIRSLTEMKNKVAPAQSPTQGSQGLRQKIASMEKAPSSAATEKTGIMEQIRLSNYDLSVINDYIGNGRRVFLLKYSLNENYEMRDVSSFQIYALLNDFSEIVKINPSLQDMETTFYPEVFFIISTDKDEAFIRDKTYLKDMITKMIMLKVTVETLKELENILLKSASREAVVHVNKIQEKIKQVSQAQDVPADVPADFLPDTAKQADTSDNLQKRSVASLRVESWKIDELLNLLGELVITKASFGQISAEFERINTDIKYTLKDFLNGIQKLNLAGETQQAKEKNETLMRSLSDLFAGFDLYSESIQKLNRISSSLQENVMNMRMVPIQMVFSRFPRLIRDLADKLGKKVDLSIEGVETEIDKGMVDDIFDPLIHILRNSVDHGIEMPSQRIAQGKPEVGKIILKAAHEGDSIVIEVSDDGKGIDAAVIKKKAIESGFVNRESADQMSEKELLSLIFLPGLSTSQVVSDLSGRGVGMDVVKKKIEEIGGSVGVMTAKGKGTKIIIRLPLTLAIIQGLLVIVNGMNYVIPVASVEETVIINIKDLKEINNKLSMELRGKFIPILSLNQYFYKTDSDAEKDGKVYCIVSRFGESLVGVLVGEVVGEQDIVIKPLNTKLIKSRGISAATIIGNGDIGYIVDTSQIIGSYFRK